MKYLSSLIALCALTGCFSANGRTVLLDPISGPGWIMTDAELDALKTIPGVLTIHDRNDANEARITFYPSTGERIASGIFKRDYAPDFGAVDASLTYQSIVAQMEIVCQRETASQRRNGIRDTRLETVKDYSGPTYMVSLACKSEPIPYQQR